MSVYKGYRDIISDLFWVVKFAAVAYILACVWVIAVLFVWVMQALKP